MPMQSMPMPACAAVLAMLLAGPVTAAERWQNLTAGGPLRPGVYGRIAVHDTPPPLLQDKPTRVTRATVDAPGEPLYLYVPPGQVRRWAQHCAKWDACDRPVYFVRMDESPSRLGAWKKAQQREQPASAVLHALNRFTQ